MGRKPKAGGAKGKATDPEQFARFLEAAREAGVDETGEAFERAFGAVVGIGRAAPKKAADKDTGKPANRSRTPPGKYRE